MKIIAGHGVINPDDVRSNLQLDLPGEGPDLNLPDGIAYVPLINSHDHLVGNWVPKAGDKRPYPNSHIWVEDMKQSFSFRERNQYWLNDGSFDLLQPTAHSVAKLGAYKNLFSGCGIVHDHGPNQQDAYYDPMPIIVPKRFRQCHSITLGNWWGGGTPEEEMALTQGKMPFIIHLGEGTDEVTHGEFALLEKRGLLQANTLMIHGIAFSKKEIETIAKVGASVCWCPGSNYYLIGKTFDIASAMVANANVVIGTDSTMSGEISLIAEFEVIREHFPQIPLKELYRMVTVNAAKALYLDPAYATLNPANPRNLLILDQMESDPFENLLAMEMMGIKLLIVDGVPRYGDSEYLDLLDTGDNEYTIFRTGNREKFVIGDPMEINDQIDNALGYHKDFPFLPF
ncbi:MAG: amidohydrolase family protein [Candidatus Cloacimonetes bacterium]|nr:amidohydrolase family protein [Candidatus Cloacimonadota bacterium]